MWPGLFLQQNMQLKTLYLTINVQNLYNIFSIMKLSSMGL